MAIAEAYKSNFEVLIRAVKNGDISLVECTDAQTGFPVITVCAVHRTHDEFAMIPLAKLFDGNPYEELRPPELDDVSQTT